MITFHKCMYPCGDQDFPRGGYDGLFAGDPMPILVTFLCTCNNKAEFFMEGVGKCLNLS